MENRETENRKMMSDILYVFVLAVNGKFYQDFMFLHAPYMIGFKNGKEHDFSDRL